ncbi:hypothetical protein CEXT_811301 [Caerostris extrusa]|uniref:Maturase K n=1 Tax=Caerostris extrusa TaxID=172846 RepID=A0AAV4SIZ9_CAEEX|nr:hypothetical protein CEXT_811301 [Caerostris extrusa]
MASTLFEPYSIGGHLKSLVYETLEDLIVLIMAVATEIHETHRVFESVRQLLLLSSYRSLEIIQQGKHGDNDYNRYFEWNRR